MISEAEALSRKLYDFQPQPYQWQSGWTDTDGSKGNFKCTSTFKPNAQRQNYGSYEATTGSSIRSNDGIRARLAIFSDGYSFNAGKGGSHLTGDQAWLCDPNSTGGDTILFADPSALMLINKASAWSANSSDGALVDRPVVAEYFYDTATNRAVVILYKLSAQTASA